MEIEYHGVRTIIGKLTIEQAQDFIFELLNEREDMHQVIQKMYFYGKMDKIIERDLSENPEEPQRKLKLCCCYDCAHIGHQNCGCCKS